MEEQMGQRPRGEAEAHSQLWCACGSGMGPIGELDECRAELLQRCRAGPETGHEEDLVPSRLEGWEHRRDVDVESAADGEVCYGGLGRSK